MSIRYEELIIQVSRGETPTLVKIINMVPRKPYVDLAYAEWTKMPYEWSFLQLEHHLREED